MSKLKKIILSVIAVVLAALVAAGVAFLVIDGSGSTKVSLSEAAEVPEAYETVDVGSEGYNSLGDYISDNLSTSSSNQKTIVLTAHGPYYIRSQINIPASNYITIDLNGASVFSVIDNPFYVAGTLTIIDSSETITSYGTVTDSITLTPYINFGNGTTSYYTLEREPGMYEKYYVKTGCIFDYHTSSSQTGMVQITGGGTFNMYGGAIVGSQSGFEDANSSGTMIYAKGSSSSQATFNMYGGFICAKHYSNDYGRAVFGSYSNVNLYGGLIGGASGRMGSATYMCNTGTLNVGGNSVKYGSSNFDAMYIGGNTATGYGTIYTYGSVNSNIYSNTYVFENTASHGSGIYNCGSGKTTMYGGNFFNNNSTSSGTIVMTSSPGTFTMSGGYFYGNSAKNNGAAVWLYSGASMTITGGTFSGNEANYGGALYTQGDAVISISGATFENNCATSTGGAIYSLGSSTVTIKNSTFSGNQTTKNAGGAIYTAADITMTISNVTFNGNSSGSFGGALALRGGTTVSNSTFTKNTSGTYGGAIAYTGTSISISDTEISGNTAGTYGGGLYMNGDGDVSLSGLVTVDGNAAGTDADGDDEFNGLYGPNVCIVADYFVLGGTLSSSSSIGVTLTGDRTQITSAETSTSRYKTSAQYFFLDEDEDRFVGYLNGDTFLSAISKDKATITVEKGDDMYYSNDLTMAVARAAGTSEDDAGTIILKEDVDVDQTVTVEAGTFVALDLNGCTVTWTGSSKSNFFLVYGSLDLYDSEAKGGTLGGTQTPGVTAVVTETGTQYRTVYGVMDEKGETTYYYYLSGAITGGQANGSDEAARGGGVYVEEKGTFTMYGGTIYGNTSTFGGGVHNYGTFTMYGGAISENRSTSTSATYNGSAFLNEDGAKAYLYGGVIYGNVTSGKGYGIIDNMGTLVLDKFDENEEEGEKAGYAVYDTDGLGPVISGNTSSGYGGILNRGSLTMNAGYITLNSAGFEGGGVNTNGSGFTMSGGYITGNTTSYYGAGVHVVDTFIMTGGYISYNESSKYAGGVNVLSKGTFVMTGGEISNNTAKTYGGGICSAGTLEISGGTVTANKANGGNGGGIYASSSATTTISGGTISCNAASETGGGVWSQGILTMTGGTIMENRAESYAGGVEIYSSTFTMTGGMISNNSAPRAGAVSISQKGTTFVMSGGTISGNRSTTGNGGGVYAGLYGTFFTMTGGTITGNESAGVGGGVFCNDNSTVVLSGGEIYGNTATTYGGGVYFTSSAALTIGGEVEIKENLDASGAENDLYFLSGTTVTVDETFSGTVYVYSAATPTGSSAVKFSKNTMKAEDFLFRVSGKILSDQGYCAGYSSYIYLYKTHNYSVIYVDITDGGAVAATHYCSQCFMSGEACEEPILYELRVDGTVLVYVEENGCKCYGSGSDGGYTEGGLILDGGALVVAQDGSLAWYEDLAEAVAAAGEGDTVILLSDVESTGDTLNLELSADVTLDLNGHTIACDVSVGISEGSDAATLTITDSSESGTGNITGDITGEDGVTVAKEAGTYTEKLSDIGGDLADGYCALYGGTDDENIIYTVYSQDEIYDLAEVYVEIDNEDGTKTVLYYSTLKEAVENAPEGSTIKLFKDLDMVSSEESVTLEGQTSITIDLNGYTLVADITIEAGSYDEDATDGEKFTLGASLTIVDTSCGLTGSVAGTITVEGTSDDEAVSSGDTNANDAFSDTLVIVASAVSGDLTVVTDDLDSVNVGVTYTFAITTDKDGNEFYTITSNHEHIYNIAEAFMDTDGEVKVRVKCSCDKYFTETVTGEGEENAEVIYIFAIPGDAVCAKAENGDGTVTYTFTPSAEGEIKLTYGEEENAYFAFDKIVLTIAPVVKVEIKNESGDVTDTYYLDEDSLGALSDIINGAGGTVVVTLMSDTYVDDLEISGESVIIDLNGHELTGSITLSSSSEGETGATGETPASLEITDSSASSDEGTASIGEGKVSGVTFSLDSGSTLVLSGGTYDDDVTVTDGDAESDIKNYVNSSAADDKATYCMVDNGDGTFTVTTTDIAERDAAVKVVIGEGESEQHIYFGSVEAAVTYVNGLAEGVDGATIVLIKDCEVGEDGLDIASSVTIDLAGNTLTANINVEENGSLKVTDSSAEDGDYDSTGLLAGSLSGEGSISVESGSFTEDVGQYVTSGSGDEKVLLATSDEEGNVIYTVTDKSSVETSVSSGYIQASVTYAVGEDETVTVYYESIEEAIASLNSGDTLTILTDIEDPVEITIADGMDVTIDLGGHTLTADITVEDGSSLTVKDSAAEAGSTGGEDTTGLLDGSLSGDGSISVESGSFTEDVGQYVASGSGDEGETVEKVLLATSDNEDHIIYTVTDKDSVEASVQNGCVQAKITYTVENGDGSETTVTVYYESIEDAIASLKDGDTLMLLTDIDGDVGLSFENTSEERIGITLDLNGNDVKGGISVGEGVDLTIIDGSGDAAGAVSGDVIVNEGAELTIEGGIYEDDVTKYAGEGRVVCAEATYDGSGEWTGYVFEVVSEGSVDEAVAKVTFTYTDEDGREYEYTVYFDDLQSAIDYAGGISSGDDAAKDVVVTLTGDCTAEEDASAPTVSVESGSFTIDMNGYTTDIDLEISGDASVTILAGGGEEGEFEGNITVKEGGSLDIYGDVTFTGAITDEGSADITISGGTFSTDVSAWTEDGFAAIASSDESGNLSYTVTEEDSAKGEAKASVTVTTTVDGEKVETTTYYDSFEDALNALYEAMESGGSGAKFTLTLWDDVDIATDVSKDSDLLTGGEALILEGTFTFDLNEHNFSGDVYAGGASDDSGAADVAIDINGGTFAGDITVADGAGVDIDLSGGTYEGNVTVGEKDGTEGATLAVTDSSAEYGDDGAMTETGTGLFDGTITDNNSEKDSITVDGGTFTSAVGDYVNSEKYETIIGIDVEGGETFVIVPKTDVDDFSAAYVTVKTDEGETVTYYESLGDAINAAAANGGTVTLTGDASVEGLEISSSVTIDLNGYDLTIDIVIDADAGGQLAIKDSEGTGELSGTITVVGTKSCEADNDGNAVNPYGDVLVIDGGAAPGANLTIDLTSLGAEGEFTYAVTSGENDDNVTYGIVPVDGHRDVYSIAIWTLGEDGTATLRFMCACGNYLCDKNGNIVEYTAEATVTDEGDGVYTFSVAIEIEKDSADGAPEGTYEKSWTVAVAATVKADGKTYYMSDLQSAIELAESLGGGVVTLYDDCEDAVEVRGDVEINLNGHDIEGGITVDTGAYLIISGDGDIGGVTAGDKANIKLRGGTYGAGDDIYSYVDGYEGYAAFVNENGSVTVMQESDAAANARAAVTNEDDDTVYYESLNEAVEAMTDGSTLTLWDVIGEDETVEIEGLEGVTVDANGYDIEGTLTITECDDVALDMDGGDIIGSVTFTDSENATLSMGGEGVSSGDIEGEVSFSGCENSSVDMDGGDVKSTGSVSFTDSVGASFATEGGDIAGSVTFGDCEDASMDMGGGSVTSEGLVEFTGSTDASFDAEGGDIDGTVSFTDCEDASVSMGNEDEKGGDINGKVTFEGCEDASVDMDGGTVTSTGSVEFTGSTGASFDAEGGDINGSVSFTECGDASVSMGSENTEGGNINGIVTFDDSENASVDMDGGNVAEGGTVSFDGCDGAEFDLDGGEMNGTVTFTESDSAEFDLGGGTVGESGEANFNQSENSVIDLGDGTFSGTMSAADGSFVEITGSGDATDGTFSTDGTSELELHGGTYDEETFETYYGTEGEDEEGYRAVENEDGSYTVMTEDEFRKNASASVTYEDDEGNTETVHFATLGEALEYVESLGNAPYILVTLEDDYSGNIDFVTDDSGDVTFDLSGHEVTGDISMTGGGTLTIVDSEGGAYVGGELKIADDDDSTYESDIVVEGGTYSSEDVSKYVVDDEYVIVVGHDSDDNLTYTVMKEEEAVKNSYVYVETYDEEGNSTGRTYYENLEDAVENADDGTIVLTGDLDVSDCEIEITTDTVIDTNGHSLTGDFVVVVADDCGSDGSLTVKDSSEDGSGSFTGKVTVEDRSTGTSGEETDYSDAFTLEDGITPDGVDTDLSGLNGDGSYHFEKITDDDGNTSYGIVEGGSHSYTIPVWSVADDGTITLELMCECGEYLEDADGNKVVFVLTDAEVEETEDGLLHVTGTIEASYTYVNGNGSLVEVTGYYDCDMYLDVAATDVTSDGTLHVFESVEDAIDFAETNGGYVTLYEDASNIHINVKTQEVEMSYDYSVEVPETDENGEYVYNEDGNLLYETETGTATWVETVYTDVVIDLNGHDLEITIEADKGNSVTLTDTTEERGWAEVGLSVDGVVIFEDVNIRMTENVVEGDTDVNGEIWIRGDTTIDLSDMTIFNVDVIEGNLTLTGEEGSSMKLGADIYLSDGSITIEGSAGIDLGGNDLETEIYVSEGASFDFNLNGATFTGDIELGDGSSATIRDSSAKGTGDIDGTLIAGEDARLSVYDGVYDPDDPSFDIELSDGQVLISATDASGDIYYETADAKEHAKQGRHGYDILVSYEFDAENAEIVLTFACLCGETSMRRIKLAEDDYTAVVDENGVVTVYYGVGGTLEADNGSTYSYFVAGDETLLAITEGASGNGYLYAVVKYAGCEDTGLDTYTYGDGKGIVVNVVTPVTHRGLEKITDKNGNTYYYCDLCGAYVTGENGAARYGSGDDLVEDVGLQNEYEEDKQAALDELESMKDEIINGIDPDTPGYEDIVKIVESVFDELYDEISGMDYEAQTEAPDEAEDGWRSKYADELTEALEDALSDAMVEVEKTASQEVSRNVLQDTYNQLYDSGKYSDEALDELKGELDAAMADLEAISVTSEDDIGEIYEAYLERVLAALYAIKISRAETTDDSAYGGYVESDDGFASSVELVITEKDMNGYRFSSDSELLYKGYEDYTEDDVAGLVDGKGIVAVFDISLVDGNGTEIYVFSGTYLVRIDISGTDILAYDGLQVVYVGYDGKVEVYDTKVEDGYLEFTTTHFSEYMILGVGGMVATDEKETDLTAAIIALAVVAGVLLILGIMLLIVLLMKKGKIGGKSKKTAALGVFALLAVVPAGGVAIVVVLAVLAAAFLAADIYMIYAIFTSVPVVEYAQEGDDENATADDVGEVTLSDSEDENRE